MAKAKAKANDAEEIVETPAKPSVIESVYSAKELADNYKVFNTSREIIVVALRQAGKKSATFSEAQAIIDNFKHKEVK